MNKNKLKNLNIKSKTGYTLIELLAVMIILIAVGTIITTILVGALRGGDRSNTVTNVRQSGNYAMSQMSKMIAYAKSFDQIVDTSGGTYTDCVTAVVGATTPTPAPLRYSSVSVTSFDGGQTTFSCDNTNQWIASESASGVTAYLTNTDTTSVANCYFTCLQNSKEMSPTIGIYFDLNTRLPVGSSITPFVEKRTSIHFETSVTLRNSP